MSDHVKELRHQVVRAAKLHRCLICDHEIQRGERHHVWVYRREDAPDPRRAVRQVRHHIKCPQMELFS